MTTVERLLAIPEWPEDLVPAIRAAGAHHPVIALDDDPTGTQTVRDVPVLARWTARRLAALAADGTVLAYLLTNSRSLPVARAATLAAHIGRALAASARAGHGWSVISRSDSTLRGHFPTEVDALADGLALPDARVVLVPYFGDGGRLTIGGIHYLRRGDLLIPVAETEFARDPVFGFRESRLVDWVEARIRVAGARSRPVRELGLDHVRGQGPGAVRAAVRELPPGGVLVLDAASERDVEVLALGVLQAEQDGVPVIGRTAASYVRARAGLLPVAPVDLDAVNGGTPGLVVVGSHVPTTTLQLARLLTDQETPLGTVEIDVRALLDARERAGPTLMGRAAAAADEHLQAGRTVVVWTSRELIRGLDHDGDLRIAAKVSWALVQLVQQLRIRPAWIIAKGGITSSDVATAGLAVTEARVVGPLLPGVPVWRCGLTSRWPGLDLVVFPGNVGDADALRLAVRRMIEAAPETGRSSGGSDVSSTRPGGSALGT